MPPLQTARTAALRLSKPHPSGTTTPKLLALSRPFSSSQSKALTASTPRFGGHESHYDAPTGWLFNVPPGEKYKKEGWEGIWFYGFFGSFLVTGIAYAFKPDTSIQTWALEEARRRLEAEGILEDPEKKE